MMHLGKNSFKEEGILTSYARCEWKEGGDIQLADDILEE